MFQNAQVGIWCLSIKHGAQTSLHCHPTKKTGLVVVAGHARISYLNDSVDLSPPAKLMIRPGLFHRTEAISPEGISVIEVETPVDKSNLVRLEDEYDRQGTPYEGRESMVPMDDSCIKLDHPVEGKKFQYAFQDCDLCVEMVTDHENLMHRPPGEVIVVLDGGLFAASGEPILSHGDVVSADTMERLAATFNSPRGISMLTIRKAR